MKRKTREIQTTETTKTPRRYRTDLQWFLRAAKACTGSRCSPPLTDLRCVARVIRLDTHVSRVLSLLKKRGGKLLSLFDFDQLRELSSKSKIHTVAEGGILLRQGDSSDCMYIVLQGGLRVVRCTVCAYMCFGSCHSVYSRSLSRLSFPFKSPSLELYPAPEPQIRVPKYAHPRLYDLIPYTLSPKRTCQRLIHKYLPPEISKDHRIKSPVVKRSPSYKQATPSATSVCS